MLGSGASNNLGVPSEPDTGRKCPHPSFVECLCLPPVRRGPLPPRGGGPWGGADALQSPHDAQPGAVDPEGERGGGRDLRLQHLGAPALR